MPRGLKIALVWMLTLLLPLYGMASVPMGGCAPAAPHALSTAAAPGGSTHLAHAPAEAHAQPGSDAAAGDAAAAARQAGHKCSACAACCAGIALPSVAPVLASSPPAGAAFPPPSAALRDLVMPGPERPPRAFAA